MLDSVGNVIATILRRSEGDSMPLSLLHPFAVRLFFEHLLPSNDLATTDLPSELANPASLVRYLREWDTGRIVVEGEEGQYVARLVAPDPPHAADAATGADGTGSDSTTVATNGTGEQAPEGQDGYGQTGGAVEEVSEAEMQEVHCVRQLLCSTLLDWILTRNGATHYSAATGLEEARLRCIELLVKAFPDAPPELMSTEGLEDLLISQPDNFMITLHPGRRKMVFKHTPPPAPAPAPAPAAPTPLAPRPLPTSSNPNAARAAGKDPYSAGSAAQGSAAAAGGAGSSGVGAGREHGPMALRDAVVAHLVKEKAVAGPSSIPVEDMRRALLKARLDRWGTSPPQLETLEVFRAVVESIPGTRVWVATSGTLRCMLPTALSGVGGGGKPKLASALADASAKNAAAGVNPSSSNGAGAGGASSSNGAAGKPGPYLVEAGGSAAGQHAPPPNAALRDAIIGYLTDARAFDGPKSVAVDEMRRHLQTSRRLAWGPNPPQLQTVEIFRKVVESVPKAHVWLAKKSAVLRCMLSVDGSGPWPPGHGPEGPFIPSGPSGPATLATPEKPVQPMHHSWMAALPHSKKIYRAVHIYLIAQTPPATSAATSVKAHTLLKALRSVGGEVAWRNHPALNSVSSFLKFVQQDAALEWVEGDSKESLTVYIVHSHLSAKIAHKTLTQPLSRVQTGEADDTQAVGSASHVNVPTGYPALGAAVERWGPTTNPEDLRTFLSNHAATKMWGFDHKVIATPGTSEGSSVTLVTLSVCRACLIWDVSGAGVPPELVAWLEDPSLLKCRVSAKTAVEKLATAFDVKPAGFLDLLKLCKEGGPVKVDAFATFPAMASQVLNVKVTTNALIQQSNWGHRPLSSLQQKHTMQSAWLHAHLLQSLGSSLQWDMDRLKKCLAHPASNQPAAAK